MATGRAIFLDRDGVLNVEKGRYVFLPEDFEIVSGVIKVLRFFKSKDFRLIVITNQAGIGKGLYTVDDMNRCHDYFQAQSGNLIDHFYFAPDHPSVSESLSRKPGKLLFEKALAKYDLDPRNCWMIGDKERDLIPAKSLRIKTVILNAVDSEYADFQIGKIEEFLEIFTKLGASNGLP